VRVVPGSCRKRRRDERSIRLSGFGPYPGRLKQRRWLYSAPSDPRASRQCCPRARAALGAQLAPHLRPGLPLKRQSSGLSHTSEDPDRTRGPRSFVVLIFRLGEAAEQTAGCIFDFQPHRPPQPLLGCESSRISIQRTPRLSRVCLGTEGFGWLQTVLACRLLGTACNQKWPVRLGRGMSVHSKSSIGRSKTRIGSSWAG